MTSVSLFLVSLASVLCAAGFFCSKLKPVLEAGIVNLAAMDSAS